MKRHEQHSQRDWDQACLPGRLCGVFPSFCGPGQANRSIFDTNFSTILCAASTTTTIRSSPHRWPKSAKQSTCTVHAGTTPHLHPSPTRTLSIRMTPSIWHPTVIQREGSGQLAIGQLEPRGLRRKLTLVLKGVNQHIPARKAWTVQ